MSDGVPSPDSRQAGIRLARAALFRWGVLLALLALIVFFTLATSRFFSANNWNNIIRDMAVDVLIALAVTVSVVVNGFDVSVGANASLAVVVSMTLMVTHNQPTWLAVVCALAAGALVGIANAALILLFNLPDLLATLGSLFVIDGVAQILDSGQTITPGTPLPDGTTTAQVPQSFLNIDQGTLAGVPVPTVVMAVVVLLVLFLLGATRWGRLLYAIGSNTEAARLSGVPVRLYRAWAYVLSGLLAALGGVLLAARLGLGENLAGDPYLLNSVGATMIGFAVLGAGRANVPGTLAGALIIAVLVNGLTMLNVPYYTQEALLGAVVLGALALSFAVRERL